MGVPCSVAIDLARERRACFWCRVLWTDGTGLGDVLARGLGKPGVPWVLMASQLVRGIDLYTVLMQVKSWAVWVVLDEVHG